MNSSLIGQLVERCTGITEVRYLGPFFSLLLIKKHSKTVKILKLKLYSNNNVSIHENHLLNCIAKHKVDVRG